VLTAYSDHVQNFVDIGFGEQERQSSTVSSKPLPTTELAGSQFSGVIQKCNRGEVESAVDQSNDFRVSVSSRYTLASGPV
jgi:hypothetical protein